MTPRRMWRAASIVAAGALVLSASGCGNDDAGSADVDRATDVRRAPDAATPSETPRPEERRELGAPAQPRPSDERTKVAAPLPQRPRGNALTVRTTGADGHLVAASALGRGWRERSTGDEGSRAMSSCHAATFHDVGADRVRLRHFAGPGEAVQAAVRFVDRRSALRIERVVQAWERDCADDLADRDAALGVTRHGRWLAVVEVAEVTSPGRDVRRALAAATATF